MAKRIASRQDYIEAWKFAGTAIKNLKKPMGQTLEVPGAARRVAKDLRDALDDRMSAGDGVEDPFHIIRDIDSSVPQNIPIYGILGQCNFNWHGSRTKYLGEGNFTSAEVDLKVIVKEIRKGNNKLIKTLNAAFGLDFVSKNKFSDTYEQLAVFLCWMEYVYRVSIGNYLEGVNSAKLVYQSLMSTEYDEFELYRFLGIDVGGFDNWEKFNYDDYEDLPPYGKKLVKMVLSGVKNPATILELEQIEKVKKNLVKAVRYKNLGGSWTHYPLNRAIEALSESGIIDDGISGKCLLRAEVHEDAVDWGMSFLLTSMYDEGELRVYKRAKIIVEDVGYVMGGDDYVTDYEEAWDENISEWISGKYDEVKYDYGDYYEDEKDGYNKKLKAKYDKAYSNVTAMETKLNKYNGRIANDVKQAFASAVKDGTLEKLKQHDAYILWVIGHGKKGKV